MFHLCKTHSVNGTASSSLSKMRHLHLPAGLRGLIQEAQARDALPLRRPSFTAGNHPAGEVLPLSRGFLVQV